MATRPLLLLLLFLSSAASASCLRSSYFGIFFEQNTASISTIKLAALARWIDTLNSTYADQGSIVIVVNVAKGEHAIEKLAHEREAAVVHALTSLGFPDEYIHRLGGINILAPWQEGSEKLRDVRQLRRVDVEYSPAC